MSYEMANSLLLNIRSDGLKKNKSKRAHLLLRWEWILLATLLLLWLDDLADGGATDGTPDRGVINSLRKSSFVNAGTLRIQKQDNSHFDNV